MCSRTIRHSLTKNRLFVITIGFVSMGIPGTISLSLPKRIEWDSNRRPAELNAQSMNMSYAACWTFDVLGKISALILQCGVQIGFSEPQVWQDPTFPSTPLHFSFSELPEFPYRNSSSFLLGRLNNRKKLREIASTTESLQESLKASKNDENCHGRKFPSSDHLSKKLVFVPS